MATIQPLAPENRRFPLDSEILSVVLEKGLGLSAIAVLLCLRSHMNVKANRFTCWPSQQTIANELGLTRRQIIRVIKKLQQANLIKVEKRKTGNKSGSNNLLQYSFVRWWAEVTPMSQPEVTFEASRSDAHVTTPVTLMSQPEVTPMSLQNNIKGKREVKKRMESSPPTPPKGAEEEEDNPSSKTKNKNNRGQPTNDSAVSGQVEGSVSESWEPLSKYERLKALKAQMATIKNGKAFDDLSVKDKIKFTDLGIEFRAVESDDSKLVRDTEKFLNDLISDRRKGVDPIYNEAAYRSHLKRDFIKGELSGFEEWRERRDCHNSLHVIDLTKKMKEA